VLELNEKGYQNVAALLGGYDAWQSANLPVEKSNPK
jgi:rhodanese-related sulfurtransferase